MALPTAPPRYPSWAAMVAPIERGDRGWHVYALQRAIGVIPATGNFGAITERRLKRWQRRQGLVADGVAGQRTQDTILELAGIKADRAAGTPEGVGYGFGRAEGADMIAATNWSVAGGVDCGAGQWRILGPPFSMHLLKLAFRPFYALRHACLTLRDRQLDYRRRNPHLTEREALEVATFAHNWPAGAEHVVRTYHGGGSWWRYVPDPDATASWVRGFTRAGWARQYVARVLRFVAS